MEYKGTVYAKIGGKYIKCTESVADLENNIADLTTQLAKANSDKEKLGELLKEIYNDGSVMYDISEEKSEYYKDEIENLLTDCGITL